MKVLSKGKCNIYKEDNIEEITVATSNGLNIRLIVDLNTSKVRAILDHKLLAKCPKNAKFEPYMPVIGFYQD